MSEHRPSPPLYQHGGWSHRSPPTLSSIAPTILLGSGYSSGTPKVSEFWYFFTLFAHLLSGRDPHILRMHFIFLYDPKSKDNQGQLVCGLAQAWRKHSFTPFTIIRCMRGRLLKATSRSPQGLSGLEELKIFVYSHTCSPSLPAHSPLPPSERPQKFFFVKGLVCLLCKIAFAGGCFLK